MTNRQTIKRIAFPLRNLKTLTLAIVLLLGTTVKAQNWNEIAKSLLAPYAQDLPDQYYGYATAIDGSYAVIGAPGYENNKGTAFVLFYNGTNWVTQAQLTISDGVFGDYFGGVISISGDNIVISGTESAYVFTKSGTGWADMTETAKLTASDVAASDQFGESVSISGDNIVIGAWRNSDNGNFSGSAYVFTKP